MDHLTFSPWSVTQTEWSLQNQRQFESIFCQGNGYMGVRCAVEEAAPGQQRGTFVAGTFNRFGQEVTELPNMPDLFGITLTLDGEALLLTDAQCADFSRTLDLKNGLVTRRFGYTTASGIQAEFVFERFISLANHHLGAQRIRVSADRACTLSIQAGINGQVSNSGAQHLLADYRQWFPGNLVQAGFTTSQSGVGITLVSMGRMISAQDAATALSMARRSCHVTHTADLTPGEAAVFTHIGGIYTSRDLDAAPAEQTRANIQQAMGAGFDALLEESAAAWQQYWDLHDLQIDSDNPFDQTAARFALYHLRVMTPLHDPRMNIGAKGLSGEDYKGHTFWDTEMFMLAPWLYTQPQVAKNLLHYRYLLLDGAREKARQFGMQGALFPWESAWITDGEVTPPEGEADVVTGKPIVIKTGVQEIHVNADVALGITRYYAATGDTDFMRDYGYEILFETALYWASRASWNELKQRYEILVVIGPDEYSEEADNNAYTNWTAHRNIQAALEAADQLSQSDPQLLKTLNEKTGFAAGRAQVEEVAQKLYLPMPDERGLIPQDDTFLTLPELDLTPFKGRTGQLLKAYNVDTLRGYQVSKQADVVALLSLLPNQFSPEVAKANLEYYEAHCVHDSSLSYNTHSQVAAALNQADRAYELFTHAASVDLNAGTSSTAGIHAAAMGGIWQCVVLGFGGVSEHQGKLHLSPRLPHAWRQLRFTISWQGTRMDITLTPGKARIQTAPGSAPVELIFHGAPQRVHGMIELDYQ